MKLLLRLFLSAIFATLAAGCGAKKKEISESARREATLHLSEAQFALSVRDYARAEPLLAKAAALTPDVPGLWFELGKTRMKLNNRSGAKDAYRQALAGYEEATKSSKTDAQLVSQQATVLVLLGRADEARALVGRMPAQFPNDPGVKAFVDGKPIDKMLADPKVKELTL